MVEERPALGHFVVEIEDGSLAKIGLDNPHGHATGEGGEGRLEEVAKVFGDVEDDGVGVFEWFYYVDEIEHELTEE